MRYWTVTILALAVFASCTALFSDKLTGLLDAGTCASGNQPFVVARECPEGTETDGFLLGASVLGLLVAAAILPLRGPRPGGGTVVGLGASMLWGWALFFTVTGAISLVHSLTSEVIGPDGKTGGIIVGVTFLLMGLPVLAFVFAGLVARLRGRDERQLGSFSSSGLADRAVTRLIGSHGPARASSGFRSEAEAPSTEATLQQLERLQRLRDSGALSEAEFAEQKRRILSG